MLRDDTAFPTFRIGEMVRKKKGSQWQGYVVGTYSTSLTPEGYAVESSSEVGSVQIYPVAALELIKPSVKMGCRYYTDSCFDKECGCDKD